MMIMMRRLVLGAFNVLYGIKSLLVRDGGDKNLDRKANRNTQGESPTSVTLF